MEDVSERVIAWYDTHARELPWRAPGVTPWGVMVSEVMLQQTPAARVVPVWKEWLERWPSPETLAAAPPGEAVRAWGRLGYPRRALRLHQAATAIAERFDGRVPETESALRSLPGVGEYTAAAIASFAFGARALVLDTNVRRLLARLDDGRQHPPASLTEAERERCRRLLPATPAVAARWAVASMELGAQVCTARQPDCGACPVSADCRWLAAGCPPSTLSRRGQAWIGTDRQCRGVLLAALRDSAEPVAPDPLLASWPDAGQARRCLEWLVADGLVVGDGTGYRL